MENDFVVLLNDLQIKCNKKFLESSFPEFYQSSSPDKNQISIQIDQGNDFLEVTKNIFQGKDYEVTNDNFGYLGELSQKIKSDKLQMKINSFCYKRECDDNQIDQHPSIQFLIEVSTLIHQLSEDNYEDVSSQIRQKLISSIDEKEKSNSRNRTNNSTKNKNDESANSEQEEEDNSENDEEKEKVLSLEMIGDKGLNKLFYFEIVNSLSSGFDSIETFQEHRNKVTLIIQLIKELDSENKKKLYLEDQAVFLNNFINYTLEKYNKVKKQNSSLMNYRQETQYLIHYLLSNKLIKLSQVHQENDPIDIYFLEFFEESQVKQFFSENEQIVEFLKKEVSDSKTKPKSKSKKNRSNDEDEDNYLLYINFISKNIKDGLPLENDIINLFLKDDIQKFKQMFDNKSIDSYRFPTVISSITCLSALNQCSLLGLSAFFGSQNIFEYLNNKLLNQEIAGSPSLPFYAIAGQHPQIIKSLLERANANNDMLEILSFCNDHHYHDTYEMIINIDNCPTMTVKQLDERMKKCLSRSYFDFIPNLLKEGATVDVLLNLFCKLSNEIGIEYMLEFAYINVNAPYNNQTPLEYCINNKNERGSLLLLKNDFINVQNIDNKSKIGETIIHTSCRLGLPKVVSYLLRNHLYDVNLPTQTGICPIHYACESGSYETVSAVIHAKKVHIRTKVKTGEFMKRTALHFACCSGNSQIITLLLDSDLKLGLDDVDCKEKTPIIYAIKGDYADCVRVLLDQEDIDINQEFKGNNLLQYACIKNKNNVFDVLLNEIIFDPNQPCADGRVILTVAIEHNNSHIVKSIIDKFENNVNVNVDTNDGKTPLIIACELGEAEIVEILMTHDLINCGKPASSDGTTPFMAAAKSGNVTILDLLKNNEDVDIYATNKLGMSAMHFAFFAEQIEAIKYLLPLFEDKLNDKTKNGETLLQIACKRGNIELSKLLINQPGVDINVHDNNGMTPFLSGVQEGKFELVKALIDSNECDLDEKSNDGKNAFLIAVESQNLDLIKFFIDLYSRKMTKSKSKNKKKSKNSNNGFVDINAKTKEDRSALFIALKLQNKDILQELIKCPLIDINETSRDRTFLCKVTKKVASIDSRNSFDYEKILNLVLLRDDLDINKPSQKYNNQTCLHIACKSQIHNIDLIDKISHLNGIDINAESKEGSPLFLLIKYQNQYFSPPKAVPKPTKSIPNNNNNNNSEENDNYSQEGSNDENEEDRNSYNENSDNNNNNDDDNETKCWCQFLDNDDLDLNLGGDPDFQDLHQLIINPSKQANKKTEYQSPLEFAVMKGYTQIAEVLISKKGIDINSSYNSKKRTPLHLAILSNNAKLVEKIISLKNLKINIQDEEGSTPLLLAINKNSHEINEIVLSMLKRKDIIKGVNLQAKKEENSPFLASVSNFDTRIFNTFLSLKGVDLECKDKKGRTALYLLVKNLNRNNIKDVDDRIISLLEKCPSLLNVPTNSGKTPLFCSIFKNNRSNEKVTKIISFFLDQEGINLSLPNELCTAEYLREMKKNHKEIDNYTSLLHLACTKSIPEAIEKLIPLIIVENKSIFTQKNEDGDTVLTLTSSSESNIDSFNVIINYVKNNIDYNDPNEFDVNQESSSKMTPLHSICNMNETEKSLNALDNLLSIESLNINAIASKGLKTALHFACLNNNKAVVQKLINFAPNVIDPNIYDNDGNTPLLIAAVKNESSIIKRLLRLESINVNLAHPLTNKTPLHVACENWSAKIVKRLLDDIRTNPNCQIYPSGKTPLMYSIEGYKADLFEMILVDERIDLDVVDSDQLSCLHYACLIGKVEFIREILSKKESDKNFADYLNAQTNKGLTPFHCACLSNNKEAILFFLQQLDQVDINIVDKNEFTPFDVYLNNQAGVIDEEIYNAFLNKCSQGKLETNALVQEICENNHYEVTKFIIEKLKFDINNNNNKKKMTILHILCKKQKIELIKELLKIKNIDINCVDIDNMTPLHHSVIASFDAEIVKLLLETGKCDINARDIKGRTALHYACELGKTSIVEELMQYKDSIDINATDENGFTPLHDVANSLRFDIKILNLLLKSNYIDPNITDKNGDTPLHLACLRENNLFVSSLIELSPVEINLNILNKKLRTPLFNVCMNNSIIIFNSLFSSKLSHKIDINLSSPIYIAAMKKNIFLVEKLLEMPGIDLNSNKGENVSDDFEYDFSGLNLMHIFSSYDSTDLLKKLIQMDQYSINEITADYIDDNMNGTPLIIAMKNNRLKNIYLLLKHYSDQLDLSLYDKNGKAAVHYCFDISNGLTILQELIKIDDSIVNMETQDKQKLTPLLIAFQKNQIDCAIHLLQQPSINVFCINGQHETPVHFAATQNRKDVIDFILIKLQDTTDDWNDVVDFINTENINGETALFIACNKANYYVVKTLIDTFKDSLDFSITDEQGNSPFVAAIRTNDNDLIHLLLTTDNCIKTIDISRPINENNDYIPQLMAKGGSLENFKLLIEQASSNSSDLDFDFVNVKNDRGETLITIAAGSQNIDLFNYICESQNPDLNILIDGKIPLVFKAAQSYDVNIFKSILDHGSFDINSIFDGKTVLHYACESYRDANEKVKLLIKMDNIDVNCATKKGAMTPLHLAIKRKKSDVIETLLNLGSKIDINKLNAKKRSPKDMAHTAAIRKLFFDYEMKMANNE